MKKYLLFGLLVCLCVALNSCSETADDDGSTEEFSNWQERNDAYFAGIRSLALDSINQAKKTYGEGWQEKCNWRAFLSFSLDSTCDNASTDSIYVQVLKRGKGSGCPLGSDSVRVFYRGRLMPSVTYPEGFVFDHSGQSSFMESIFNHSTGVPAVMSANTTVKGFGTALMNMHVGDLWRVYIPYELAYKKTSTGSIPAYSTLIFEIELVAYYRKGSGIPAWN